MNHDEIRNDVKEYLVQEFKPAGLSCYRDFSEEQQILREHNLGLQLWIACHRYDRWQEFFPEELPVHASTVIPGNRKSATQDISHKSPYNLLKMYRSRHDGAPPQVECLPRDIDHLFENKLFPGLRLQYTISWRYKSKDIVIFYRKESRLYLPSFAKKGSPSFQGPVYYPISPCLYAPEQRTPWSAEYPIFLTDDLLCAHANSAPFYGFRWCSFYSADGTGDGVDFSPLKNHYVIILVYPRAKTSNTEQIQRALKLGDCLKAAGVSQIEYAFFIQFSQDPSLSVRLEPLLMDEDEMRGILNSPDGSQEQFYAPSWLRGYNIKEAAKISETPDIQVGNIISLTGGHKATQLAFLAACMASISGTNVILPALKRERPARTLWLIAENSCAELQSWLQHYGLQTTQGLIIPGGNAKADMNLLPISANTPEPSWERSTRTIDTWLGNLDAAQDSDLRLLVVDCAALANSIVYSKENAAELGKYFEQLAFRGTTLLFFGLRNSWLIHSLPATIAWQIRDELVSANGRSFRLLCPSPLSYRLFLKPCLHWKQGQRKSLTEQIVQVRDLYAQNHSKPFGSGRNHKLTVQDIIDATGFSESQVKKIRVRLGLAAPCPQRGRRKQPMRPPPVQ